MSAPSRQSHCSTRQTLSRLVRMVVLFAAVLTGLLLSPVSSQAADWAKNFGIPASYIYLDAIATDSSGNTYVGGIFDSSPLTLGSFTLTKIGVRDAFVAKMDVNGTVLWAKNFGGPAASAALNDIAVDAGGNVYLGGYFYGADFTTPALTMLGTNNPFAIKLNSSGATTWAKSFGGASASAYLFSIAVDGSGNVYLGGYFNANLTNPALTMIGTMDAFAIKLDSSGTTTWSKNFGGALASAYLYGIEADGSGNVYLGGTFKGANLTTPALTRIGTQDAFAIKLNSSGTTTWSKNFGGASASAYLSGTAVDGSGNVYLGGQFTGANLTTPALTKMGTGDAYAIKLDSSGTTTWSKNFGGSGANQRVTDLAVDGSGNVYLGGNFSGANLTNPPLTKIGTGDAFAIKLNSSGTTTWSKNFGGASATTNSYGIAVAGSSNVYLGGYFKDANLTTPALTRIGTQDALVIKTQLYTLNYSAAANGSLSGVTSQTVSTGGSGSAVSAVPLVGYHFVNWSDSSTANPRTDSGVSANISVTANFAVNQYAVTATATGNGSGGVASNTGGISYSYPTATTGTTSAINHGTNVVLTATAATGSIANWTSCTGTTAGNGTGTATCTYASLDGAKSAQATFTLNQHVLAVNKAGTGSGTVTGGGTYNYGSVNEVTAVAETGSTFAGWSGDCSGTTSPQDVTMLDRDMVCTATFDQHFNVTASVGAGGSIDPSGTTVVDFGNLATFTITPDANYLIDEVSGCGGSLEDSTYTTGPITADCDVTATFAKMLDLSMLGDKAITSDTVLNISGIASPGFAVTINDDPVTLATDGSFNTVMLLADGANPVTVDSTGAGETGSSFNRTITVDPAAPDLTVSTPADNSVTNQTSIDVSGTVPAGATLVELSVNDGTAQVLPIVDGVYSGIADLAGGLNTLALVVTVEGHTSNAKRSVTRVAPPKPSLAITAPGQDALIEAGNVTIAGAVADVQQGSTVTLSLTVDGKSYQPVLTNGAFSQTVPLETEGLSVVTVTATDELGNVSSVTRNLAVQFVDNDSDGLPNHWEVKYSLNPNDATGVNGASGDPDKDTFSNLTEYTNVTNPRIYNTAVKPTWIEVPATSTGSIRVYWGTSGTPGATFIVEESYNSGAYTEVYSGPGRDITLTSRANGSYTYRVKVTKDGWHPSAYTTGTVTCVVTIPSPPKATAVGPTWIYVPASSTTGSIRVYWGTTGTAGSTFVTEESFNGEAYAQVYSGALRDITLTGRINGSYTYRVRVVKDGMNPSPYASGTQPCLVNKP